MYYVQHLWAYVKKCLAFSCDAIPSFITFAARIINKYTHRNDSIYAIYYYSYTESDISQISFPKFDFEVN